MQAERKEDSPGSKQVCGEETELLSLTKQKPAIAGYNRERDLREGFSSRSVRCDLDA